MIDMGSISSAVGSLKVAGDIAKGLISLNTMAEVQAKAIGCGHPLNWLRACQSEKKGIVRPDPCHGLRHTRRHPQYRHHENQERSAVGNSLRHPPV